MKSKKQCNLTEKEEKDRAKRLLSYWQELNKLAEKNQEKRERK